MSDGLENLRVLDPPARFLHFAVVRRDGFERFFVEIEDGAIGAVADRVRLDLDAAAQGFLAASGAGRLPFR